MRAFSPASAAFALIVFVSACAPTGGQPDAGASAGAGATATSSAAPAVASASPPLEVNPMTASPSESGSAGPFTLTSNAFAEGDAIPGEFTCDGANVSPPLAWSGVPAGTGALVLVVDDPDARRFVHWLVLDLPGTDGELPKGVDPTAASPQQGRDDFGQPGWGGPCPPSGTHHYRFTLMALEAPIKLADHPAAGAVRDALAGANVLGTAILTGTYRRG